MLWYKGWIETRYRILFFLLCAVWGLGSRVLTPYVANRARPAALAVMAGIPGLIALCYPLILTVLAGSGIKTESDVQPRKGLHGSLYFTLSLPVSRFRLLATRAGLGMLEAAGVLAIAPCYIWTFFSLLRMQLTGSDLFAYWVTLTMCASPFYSLGVLLSTFLDDIWQYMTSMLGVVFFWWLLSRPFLPASVDVFRAMGESSPLFTHTFPWASMGVSLGAAAILFLAALKVVQTRDY